MKQINIKLDGADCFSIKVTDAVAKDFIHFVENHDHSAPKEVEEWQGKPQAHNGMYKIQGVDSVAIIMIDILVYTTIENIKQQ